MDWDLTSIGKANGLMSSIGIQTSLSHILLLTISETARTSYTVNLPDYDNALASIELNPCRDPKCFNTQDQALLRYPIGYAKSIRAFNSFPVTH